MGQFSIKASDMIELFGFTPERLPDAFFSQMDSINTNCHEAEKHELEEHVLNVLMSLDRPMVKRTEQENLEAFEQGWKANLEEAASGQLSFESLKPKYFRGSKFLRYRKGLIVSDNPGIEYDLFVAARRGIFSKYLTGHDNLYEFGCGSCQNLMLMSEMFPDAQVTGFDWTLASGEIAKLLGESGRDIRGTRFNMLTPDHGKGIEPESAVITVHAMEQIGTDFGPFLDYLLQNRPSIVVHYEPILELYDKDNMLDYLAYYYSKKRGYLRGYLPALRELEAAGKVEITEAHRPFVGGVVHESSLVVWRPL